jgi:uncharacterized RDD family membrane protein YckC
MGAVDHLEERMFEQLLFYLFPLLELIAAVLFAVRLRGTLSGVLGAIGFGGLAAISVLRHLLVLMEIEWWHYSVLFTLANVVCYATVVAAVGTIPRVPEVAAARPEHAPGEAPLAGRGARLAAQVVDLFVSLVVLVPAGLAFAWEQDRADVPVLGILLLVIGLLGLLGIQLFLLTTCGQTVGKRTIGVRIAMLEDQRNPGFVNAVLLRAFVPGLISMVPFLGTLFSLVDVLFIFREDRRCIHDLIAGTQVVAA